MPMGPLSETVQLLVTVSLIIGLLTGLLGMFLFLSFLSTRILRVKNFTQEDRIDTINYEYDGKRFTIAPNPSSVQESMGIILNSILWVLFKVKKKLHYKSILKNRVVFSSVLILIMIFTLSSFISTSNAFVLGVARHHHMMWVKRHANKNNPSQLNHQLSANSQTTQEKVVVTSPKTNSTQTEPVPSNPKKQDDSKQKNLKKETHSEHSVTKHHSVAGSHHTYLAEKPRNESSDGHKEEKKIVHHPIIKHLTKIVEVDGRPVIDTEDPEKIVNTVKDAVANGAKEIRVRVHLGE